MSTSIKEKEGGIAIELEMDHDDMIHPTIVFKLAIEEGETNYLFSIGEVCGVVGAHNMPKVFRVLHRLLPRIPATHRQIFFRGLTAAETIFVY